MSGSVVAKRYAKAMFEVAMEKNLLDQVETELTQIVETFSASPELMEWFSHPNTDSAQKKELFSTLFKELNEITQNLLFLLADRHREGYIGEIAAEYKELANEARGVAEAIVTSATPLTEEDKQQLTEVFQQMVGKTIHINNVVDSDILGGVIVQIGDRLYDGSLKTKLVRFQERLKGSRVG
ncbi:F0F1 ATP synthase subunit delta [Paenactinomyces guangxiensis]|uniref:ATP synthase subunit delta n=1 Tax=Paenactinomyces guangxiensis TaxID=1490290 RepID=A0A7W1WTZ2_9BACL|nr:F0F1 ATP synthase subunit delta [Paenactinomyces guangxiensis]MBA4495958.1 F0F1 ATP synthase subunit delta [Paenactinomyces guangxiensis]MBH8593055.1 F0F1 ATP synthase subunit delta [Paenactinomyces guangxiensis]